MSLDVHLTMRGQQGIGVEPGIFIREGGENKQITREEWDRRYPGREPVVVPADTEDDTVFKYNITHNLSEMATMAGLYVYLWAPEEPGITKASQLVEPLTLGLAKLTADREYYEQWNPENGWGNYDGLVRFVTEYLKACMEWPDAEVYASR